MTRREITSQLHELLAGAAAALKKHEVVLRQAGVGEMFTAIADSNSGAALNAAFAKFLKDTKAFDVPLSADLSTLFSDYFDRRPPFSKKKKSEFPDAVIIASLLAWCAKRGATAYVVSGDPDLRECCSESGPLFYAASVGDIISQATVFKELYDALEKALCESDQLAEELSSQIKSMELVPLHGSFRGDEGRADGNIDGIDDINIISVSVFNREQEIFTCEIEFEAALILNLNAEIDWRYDDNEDYRRFTIHDSIYHIFSAEVIVRFDPKAPQDIEFESICVYGNSVELSADQVFDRFFR